MKGVQWKARSSQKQLEKKIEREKLDCKGLYFKPLRGIEPTTRSKFLQQLSQKIISFTELAALCRKHKQVEEVKKQFQNYLNLSSWEEATKRYKDYTTEEKLKPYLGLPFEQGSMPPSFASFCEQAKKMCNARLKSVQEGTAAEEIACIKVQASTILIAKNSIDEVAAGFSSAVVQSGGIALTIIDPPKVCSSMYIIYVH